MAKEKINWKIAITAIICLTIIQVAAMHYGINGTFRMFIAAMIAAIAGIAMPTPKILKTK